MRQDGGVEQPHAPHLRYLCDDPECCDNGGGRGGGSGRTLSGKRVSRLLTGHIVSAMLTT